MRLKIKNKKQPVTLTPAQSRVFSMLQKKKGLQITVQNLTGDEPRRLPHFKYTGPVVVAPPLDCRIRCDTINSLAVAGVLSVARKSRGTTTLQLAEPIVVLD